MIRNAKSVSAAVGGLHHYRQLLAIGIPIIVGQLGTIVLGFADTLMIGHHLTTELAAAGLVNNLFGLVLLFYLGFSYGLTPVVGRLFGMGRTEDVGRKLRNSLAANMLVGLLLVVAMSLVYANIDRMGQPAALLPLIRPYFMVNLVSVLFVGLFNTMKQFFDSITRTRVPMWVMISGNILNILFNWFLIYGVGPFPEMGLLGAGLSTLGSRVFMAFALLAIFVATPGYAVYRRGFLRGRVVRSDFLEMNRLGWPVALQLGMEAAAFSLSSIMVGWLGTVQLAAHQIMITVSQLFYLVLSGLAAALSIRISFFAGRRDFTAVRLCAADGLRMALMFSALLSIPFFFCRHQLGGLFSDDVRVQQLAAQLVLVIIVYQFGDGLQYTYANSLRGIACVKPMMYYAFVAYFIINLPLGYVLGFVAEMGIVGVWSAFPVGLTVAGFLFWLRFRRELRRVEAAQ